MDSQTAVMDLEAADLKQRGLRKGVPALGDVIVSCDPGDEFDGDRNS